MIRYFYHLDHGLGWIGQSRFGEEEAAETATSEAVAADSTPASRAYFELVAHAKVYILAEKHLFGGLKTLALQKFTTSVCDRFDADDFFHAMRGVCSSTLENGEGLRAVIVSTLYKYRYLLDQKEAQVILKELGAVTYDLVIGA